MAGREPGQEGRAGLVGQLDVHADQRPRALQLGAQRGRGVHGADVEPQPGQQPREEDARGDGVLRHERAGHRPPTGAAGGGRRRAGGRGGAGTAGPTDEGGPAGVAPMRSTSAGVSNRSDGADQVGGAGGGARGTGADGTSCAAPAPSGAGADARGPRPGRVLAARARSARAAAPPPGPGATRDPRARILAVLGLDHGASPSAGERSVGATASA